jgi:hypothetical protein
MYIYYTYFKLVYFLFLILEDDMYPFLFSVILGLYGVKV